MQRTSQPPASAAAKVRQFLRSPLGLITVAVVAIGVLGLSAAGIYVFGAGGATSHAPLNTSTVVAGNGETIFTISSSGSEASFSIDEILFGQPNTVVGKTNQVSGQFAVNKQEPSKSRVGPIKVDLSTLITDNDRRNQTMQGRILETDDPSNQYATFTPTSLQGLPSSITVGQQYTFKITGELTIHGVTRSATFDSQVTPQSETQFTGQAQTTVKYKDFNLRIPNVPSVAGVSDDVKLALTFTATA